MSADLLPHDEEQAQQMEEWFQSVLVESSRYNPNESFRREREFGGSYPVSLTAERESAEALTKKRNSQLPWQKPEELAFQGLTISQYASGSWPRLPITVKRGWDGPGPADEAAGEHEVGHVCFVIHGIGEAMFSRPDSPLPSLRTATQSIAKLTLDQQLKITHQEASKAGGGVSATLKRVEYLPIEWHAKVHSEEIGLSAKIQRISLPSIPFLRSIANDVTLDVLLYMHPEFQQRIIIEVCEKLNRLYTKYRELNPNFDGSVSILGHSLGTVIAFDILSRQSSLQGDSEVAPPTASEAQGHFEPRPNISVERLAFDPKAFYTMGSPLGLFFAIRNQDLVGYSLPTCPRFFNIFHPYDPVAYRIEPLLSQQAESIPMLVPHHAGAGGLRMQNRVKQVTQEVSQTLQNTYSSVANTFKNMRELLTTKPKALADTASTSLVDDVVDEPSHDPERVALNSGNRVDWELQASALEDASEYIAAISGHAGYFDNEDVALFLFKNIHQLE